MNYLKASIRIMLLGLLAVVCVAVAVATGVVKIDAAAERTVAGLEGTGRNLLLLQTLRDAHVGFKGQVHEWKNILLRSQEPGAADKYRRRFDQEAAGVKRLLGQAEKQMRDLGLDATEARTLTAAHDNLTRKYLEALEHGDPARAEGARAIDREVRSLDRATSEDFDGAADRLEARIAQRINATLDEAKTDARSGRMVLIVTGAVGVVLALLILLWTTYDLMVQLREAQARHDEGIA